MVQQYVVIVSRPVEIITLELGARGTLTSVFSYFLGPILS